MINEKLIKGKERLAAAGKARGRSDIPVATTARLPPGQHEVTNWLAREHGGPVRVVVSKVYAWKGAKWVKDIIFLPHDRLGFWELRGYSNTADPWTDDRYS